jgi:DNA replication and repair protein RecF
MIISHLSLTDYRGYKKQDIVFGKGINFLVGNNGSGKTNLLEAIYFLTLAKSYKTTDNSVIRFEKDFARIQAKIIDRLLFEPKIIITKIGKKIIVNNKEIDKLSDFLGQVKILAFLPEDMDLLKGPPKNRRFLLDMIIGQMDRNYLLELTQYKNILKQRNELLKMVSEKRVKDYTLLDIYTEQIASSSEIIFKMRKDFISRINKEIVKMYHYLSANNKKILLEYKPTLEDDFLNNFKKRYEKDLLFKTTGIGPHRDDYDFLIDDIYAKDYASQGEQRIIILSLLLSIANIIYEQKQIMPILLLDDVFSELDYLRQNQLIKYLDSVKIQTIITTTNIKEINSAFLKNSKIFNVSNHFVKEDKTNGQQV